MEHISSLKTELINALMNSNYVVTIDEPNNVELCKKEDGSQYLLIRGDSERFGVYFGACIVTVLNHTFICNFEYGEWSAENPSDDWLLYDDEFRDTLESADGVIFGEQTSMNNQKKVFCRSNDISEDIPVYWKEEISEDDY